MPKCTSTSNSTPNKLFFALPSDKKRRRAWIKAVRRNLSDISPKSNMHCCEDQMDSVVTIVCGLVNLQAPIIKYN